MTTQIQILTIVATVLVAVERLLSKGVVGPTLTGAWKAALGAVVLLAIAVENSVVGGDQWSAAIIGALATLGPATITAVIQAVSEWIEWRRTIAKSALVGLALCMSGCGLFTPVAKSPCDGLYCLGVETAGVPGSVLLCYETERELAEAKAKLSGRGCRDGQRMSCPMGVRP